MTQLPVHMLHMRLFRHDMTQLPVQMLHMRVFRHCTITRTLGPVVRHSPPWYYRSPGEHCGVSVLGETGGASATSIVLSPESGPLGPLSCPARSFPAHSQHSLGHARRARHVISTRRPCCRPRARGRHKPGQPLHARWPVDPSSVLLSRPFPVSPALCFASVLLLCSGRPKHGRLPRLMGEACTSKSYTSSASR